MYQQCIIKGIVGGVDFAEGIIGIFIMTYPLFKLGMIGAGDVKLFITCAGALGLRRGIVFLGCTFLVTAVISLIKMAYHRNFSQRFRYFFNYANQIIQTSKLSLYGQDERTAHGKYVHMAGPACLAVLLCLGGLY